MDNKKLKKGQEIYFIGEKLPFKIMAISEKFAIVSRALDKVEDNQLLKHEVKMGAYVNLEQAFEENKNDPVYALIDFERKIKGPSIYFMKDVDYFSETDCEKCLSELESGEEEISRRNSANLDIDFKRTMFG